jgi:hypothetical protein
MTSQSSPQLPDRHLDWEGCFNARDLGGLPTRDGRETRWRSIIRSDSLDDLTSAARAAMRDHGVRTVIDLRNADERGRRRRHRGSHPARRGRGPRVLGHMGVGLLLDTLRSIDVKAILRAGGLTDDDLAAVRARLVR